MGRPFINLTGQTINGIYIKGVDATSGGAGKHKKWICVCPICHDEFITQSNHLLQDNISSCIKCGRLKFNDLTGNIWQINRVKTHRRNRKRRKILLSM